MENPFDDALIDLFSWIHPGLYAIGATPNSLTVVSGVFLLASLVALYESYFLLSAVLYIVGYSFDVFDGNFARIYGMVSTHGDLLDHVKDILVVAGIYLVIILHENIPHAWKIAFVVTSLFLSAVVGVFVGCQEIYYYQREGKVPKGSAFLSPFRKMCVEGRGPDVETKLAILRWGGLGTWVFFYVTFVMVLGVVTVRKQT